MSLVVEVTETSAQYLEYLGDTEENGDDGEGVHGTEEDGFLKVFWHHAPRHVKGLFQRTGVTHEHRVDLGDKKRESRLKFQSLFLSDGLNPGKYT